MTAQTTPDRCENTGLIKPECSCRACLLRQVEQAGVWRSDTTDEPLQ